MHGMVSLQPVVVLISLNFSIKKVDLFMKEGPLYLLTKQEKVWLMFSGGIRNFLKHPDIGLHLDQNKYVRHLTGLGFLVSISFSIDNTCVSARTQ